MALYSDFKLKQTTDRLNVVFNELTGVYDQSLNPGGYGAPNPTVASALTAVLIFTRYGDTTSYTVDIKSLFPSSDPVTQIAIPYTSFGGQTNEQMPNDIWHIEYVVTFPNSITSSNDFYFSFIKGIACCIKKLRQHIPVPESSNCNCDCGGQDKCKRCKIYNIGIIATLFDCICPIVACDLLDDTKELISYIEKYCKAIVKASEFYTPK